MRRKARSTKPRCGAAMSMTLRAAGLSDREVLLIATAIAYHNYAIRMAAAFDVLPGTAE